jgi:hypothetical protein
VHGCACPKSCRHQKYSLCACNFSLQVFLAKWKGTPVAVKVLEDEGDALATLGSPILDKLRAVSGGLQGLKRGSVQMQFIGEGSVHGKKHPRQHHVSHCYCSGIPSIVLVCTIIRE